MFSGARRRAGAALIVLSLVALAACGGGGGSSSGGGDGAGAAKNSAPAPDGAVATQMQPQLNGWAFPNFPSATFPELNFDTADLVSMFGAGPAVCVDGVADPCTLTAEAAAWARMVNQARATGHCEGLVVLASARFNKAELPETVKLASDEEEVRAVMRAFATQFVPEVQESIQKWTKASLADKVDELKRSFAAEKLEYTLGVYVESGGHAILPYAIEYPSPDIARIMVYDSNWPGRNRYVDVDLANEQWSFSFAGDDPATDPNIWSGGAGDMDLTPFEAREGTCPFCGDDTKVQSTTMLVRTDNLDWSVETAAGAVSPTQATNGDGAAARPVKGGAVITRLSPRATDRSSYDFMITIPNDVLENGGSATASAGEDTASVLSPTRFDAFISEGQGPTVVAPTTTVVPATTTTVAAADGSRAKLLFGGAASVFAVTPGGVAQFSTPGSKDKPVEVGARSIKSSDPNVDLTLASGNLVANASGPSVELGASDEGSLAVQVTTATGEVIQQEVTPDAPAVQIKADETGGVTVLEATATGEVQKTEIAADGTKTETVVDASELNLNKVEVELPPALESKAIEALPKLEDRNLNNPNYKADEAYVAPTTTVPSAAGAKEVASGASTTVPKGETASTVPVRNAALPGASSTVPVRNAAIPTTTNARSVAAAGATPTTVAAVMKPTITNFRLTTKTFGDDAFTIDPPDSNSPGGFRYSSSRTNVATVSATTGRVTIVGAGTTVITATQSAARGFEAGTITATLIVGKATPANSALKDITKTFGDDSFTIAKPTSNSNGAFTFTSSDEDVVKQSRTTGRWVIAGAGKATITVTQASTDDFISATDSLVVTVRKGTPELTAPADVSKAFLDADFDLPKPTSPSRGTFTYSSSDADIVTITGTKATIKSAGTVTVTASQAGNTDWVAASTTFKVVVASTAPTLSEFADVAKTFGDAAFDMAAPKSNSTGAITFKSSDDKVATVGERDGKVSIIGAGSVTITASQAATSGFSSGSISAKVTVAKAAPRISDLLVADKAYGDADFSLKPTSTSGATFAYSTDKTNIFTVDAKTGLVKIVGVGTATLTAKQEANANFEAGSVAVSVTVSKGKPVYSWTIPTKTFGDAAFDLSAPTSTSSGSITYSVDDATIATVTSAGRVTILKAGTATITASQVATDLHVASTTTTALVIDKLAPTLGTFTIPTKTFGDTPFTLTAPSSASSGAFSYESVDTSSTVATVASNGLVSITAAGTLQIRARQATTTNYSAASIVGTLTVNRATQQGVQASGLVAKWSFDSANTLGVNSAGTGNLTEVGGPAWTAAGKNGGALSLNGTGAYLSLSSGAIAGLPTGNSAYTLSAWIKPSAFGARGIIGWGNYGAGNQTNAFRLDSSGGLHNYWWGNDLVTSAQPNTITTSGTWAHVVANYDGTTRRIWVNGVVVATDSRGPANVGSANFAVGKTVGNEWFSGLLDDVAIYNRALTSTEIGQLASGVGAGLTISSTSGTFGTPLTLTTAGGQGTGDVTYQVASAGVANCSIVGATLTSTSGGTCTIKATKAADRNYESSTSPDTTVTINRIAQSGSITVSSTAAVAGVNLTLSAAGGSGTGTFSYAVVNAGTASCTVQGTSLITTSNGTCTITATRAQDDTYTALSSAATTITVTRQAPTYSAYTLTNRRYLGAGFTLTAPVSTSNGTFTWASSDTAVASVNSSTGAVTITGIGVTVITATQASTAMYATGSVTAELTVLTAIPTMSAITMPAKTFGDPAFTIAAVTSNSPAAITYSSSDTTVATIDSATRTITIVGPGSTTVTASQPAQGNFDAGTSSAVLNVSRVTPTLTAFGADGGSGAGLKGTRYVGYFADNVNWFATATAHGDTNQLTNFARFSSSPNFNNSAENYSWQWLGAFKASTSGSYTFCTNSDDASYIWLGDIAKTGFTTGNALVNNGGGHGMREICGNITLVASTMYSMRVQYGEGGGGDEMQMRFVPPGGSSTHEGAGYYYAGMGITKAEGDAPFTPTLPTSNSPGAFTYSSSDTSVATIDASTGLVTVVGRGSTVLTATQAQSGTWGSTTTTVEMRVLRRATVGSFFIGQKTFSSPAFTPTAPTSDSPGAWTYETSNAAVAKWSASTGQISVSSAGTATITAVQAETGEFAESRVSTTLTIEGESLVTIESGERHTCGVTASGGIACWGWNAYGQLGDNSYTNREYPVAVTGISSGAVKVATGLWHSCAVISDGTVKCWGRNEWGQLGNNTRTISPTPVAVQGITNAVDIAASGYASCAVLATGAVTCWGYGGHGELGRGNTSDSNVPVVVPALTSGVVNIDGSQYHYCVSMADGGAKCWGHNAWGNLGDGTTTQRNAPVDVLGLTSGAVRVAVSTHSSCAIVGGGSVMCWGYGANGQNGNGTGNQTYTAVPVTGITNAVDLDGGHQHFCARLASGSAQCWGWNGYGQLGTGNTSNSTVPVTVAGLPAGVRAISASYYSSCAITAQGNVWCWGYNAEYQLGDKTNTNSYVPVGVAGVKAAVIADAETQLSAVTLSASRFRVGDAGVTYTLPTTNRPNDVTIASTNTSVATIDPATRAITIVGPGTAFIKASVPATSTQSAMWTYAQIKVPNTEYVQVSANYYSSCGVTRSGGVKCWGNGDWGQLGNGSGDRRYAPTDVTDLATGVAEVATGHHHACALTTGGGVMCWGLNDYGQIGFGTTSIRQYMPVGVTGLSSGVIQVDAGYQHTCALTSTGGVKCWGLNNNGQLGDGTNENRTTPVDVVGLTSGVAGIDLGHEFSCARLVSGGVKCWGYNGYGQLGDGTTTNRLVPRSVSGLTDATSISAGFHHACAVQVAGTVRCWGYGGYGQNGDNSTSNRATSVAVSGIASGATKVVAGGYHTCALMSTGGLKCWGRNDSGELGDGTTTRRYTPVDVTGLTAGVIEVSAANGHSTCAIVANDALKCWGFNDWGQVGNLSTGNVLLPSDVDGAFATTARATTTLGALALPGSGYTTSSAGFTLVAPTSNRTVGSLSCAAGGICKVGDIGPGGGRVFYASSGFAAPGTACASNCRYLEAAPITWAGTNDDPRMAWSGNTTTAIGTAAQGTAIGSGYANTDAIIAQSATTNRAATASRAYNGGGLNDWYLPAVDELRQLYLKRDTVGSLSCGEWYQASTEYDAGSRWLQHPCQDSTVITGKGDSRYVRPIRAFAPTNTDAPLTFASSDPTVATVDRWTGAVTITGAGSTVLAATQGGTGEARVATSRVTLSVVTSCADGGPCGQGEVPPVGGSTSDCQRGIACAIGDTGPGGGKVFFVDTNDEYVGFDYMEVAATESSANWCNTASASTSLSGAGDNVQGFANMQAILATCSSGAATVARNFTAGSKTDWYLPSPTELALVKTNLVDASLISGLSGDYWTSRQYDATRAYTVDPVSGVQTYASKTDTRIVRPVRAFSGKGAVTINAVMTGFALPASSYVFGTAPFASTAPTSLNPAVVSYTSSNTAVATIDQYSGTVTIIGAGSTTFTATKDAFGSYVSRTQTASFTVTKATPTLTGFTVPGGPYRADAPNFTMVAPTVSTSDAGVVSYTSSDTAVATINSSTGVVDLLTGGSTTLTASVPGSANWNAASTTYSLNVGALCKDGGTCFVGDEGPGGGTVFLVDTNNEYPTLDFMEIAPADASSSAGWCPAGTSLPTTAKTVGAGATNSSALLDANSSCAAAAAADGYSTSRESDWFLPSKAEFDLAVTNLATVGVTLPAGTYWTSSRGVDSTGTTASPALPASSGVATVPGLGSTYVDMATAGGGWKLVGYAENGSVGKLLTENGAFDAATRTGSANLDMLEAVRGADEMAISWTGAGGSLPTGGITSYDHAVSFPLPAASAMTLTGTASTPPTYNWTTSSFGLSGTSPDQSLVTLTTLQGSPGLPSQMYMRNKTFGVEYGGSYGLVSNTGINQQLDWSPDSQAFSAIYLRHSGLSGFITPSGTGSGYTPRTVAIWVRNTPGAVMSMNIDPCAATKSRVGSDIVLTFANPGTCRWTPPAGVTSASVLVVAGGGGAGGGGGGGGGLRYDAARTLSGAVDITIGAGGMGTLANERNVGLRGGSSAFGTFSAVGGGGGGNYQYDGTTGGSGGGNGQDRIGTGPAGTAGQGNAGGTSNCDWYGGGAGGGGAGGVGDNGGPTSSSPLSSCWSLGRGDLNPTYGGNGGAGLANAITGSNVVYAGGGGGGVNTNAGALASGTSGIGGTGGGGNGALCNYCHGDNGVNGLGGGGGGGDAEGRGGNGGHGTVIVRYAALTDSCPVSSSTCAVTMTAAGVADTAMTTATAQVRAVRSWQRRSSCKDIKDTTGTNANGVYAINVNHGGVIVPTQAYCIMDSAMAGGGWTMIMKSAQNSTTFPYASNYWTTANTLNDNSLSLTSADAKFSTFNQLSGTEMLAVFPDIDTTSFGATERGSVDGHNYGWTWKTSVPGGPKTALAVFQGPDEQFVSDALTFDGYRGTIWSSQSDIRFYGFNWNDNLKARWGFGWNENGGGLWPNGAKGSDDTSGGIGLNSNNWSAGDVLNCCHNTVGLRRSMAVNIFIR